MSGRRFNEERDGVEFLVKTSVRARSVKRSYDFSSIHQKHGNH